MERFNKILKKLLFPPVWLTAVLIPVCAGALTAVFLKGWEESPAAYAVYVLSFYTLCVACLQCWKVLPGWYGKLKTGIYDHPLGNRYMTDPVFKTHVSLYLSLAVNLLYVGINVLSVFLYRSAWFGILAVYYSILAVMRFLLLRYTGKNRLGSQRIPELKRSRVCAVILMTLNLVLSGAVLMILYQDKGYEYHGILIYVMAAYTFYMTTHAIVDLVKYRKYKSPVMTTGKIISLSSALVSMLSLETAMFSQFGAEMSARDQRIMIAATGGGVSVAVVTMSLFLILRANREIREYKRSQQ